MKKVIIKVCRLLMASAAALIMFSGLKTAAYAANDTVVIDFSKAPKQSYTGKKLTSPDWDQIEKFNLNEEEKNVVFLSTMVQLYKIFNVETDCANCNETKGRIIVNSEANQSIGFSQNDKGIFYDAGTSAGTYEMMVTSKYLEKRSKSWIDAQMPFFAAMKLYGVQATDSGGARYFKLKIIFNNPDSVHVKVDENGKVETQVSEDIFEVNGLYYKITGENEVAFTGAANSSRKSLKIPDTVSYKNKRYDVTSIANKALYNNKSIKKITFGKNVAVIGRLAFAKCRKLKRIIIKTETLSKVGKKAIYKNAKNLKIKVPKAQDKKYRKLFKKAGIKCELSVK